MGVTFIFEELNGSVTQCTCSALGAEQAHSLAAWVGDQQVAAAGGPAHRAAAVRR